METLKQRFIQQYVILMSMLLILYIFIYHFFMSSSFMVLYLIAGLVILDYTYLLIRKKYNANYIMSSYMIVAPLYNSYILLVFWGTSVASFVMLFPVPLAAYIFFSKKSFVGYSLYLVGIIVGCFFIHKYSGIEFEKFPHEKIMISDIIIFCFNLVIIVMLLIYNNKIHKLRFLSEFDTQKPVTDRVAESKITSVLQKTDEKESIDEEMVEKLKNIMENEMLFKKPNLNISALSTHFNVNYTHISRIIRYKGYANFNHYLNSYRIKHVKMLINEGDLQKMTLMYIYTEAGFSNQATFNRVFKQIEGITPSEYINSIKEKSDLK